MKPSTTARFLQKKAQKGKAGVACELWNTLRVLVNLGTAPRQNRDSSALLGLAARPNLHDPP